MTTAPELSVVVPCYNEADVIERFHKRLAAAMNSCEVTWEVIYVNDGSQDDTLQKIGEIQRLDGCVATLNLSRNFGKEVALTAGLDHSRGAAVVVIDADLQDPPELISELLAMHRKGYDVVFAQRRQRHGETLLKKVTADAFYRLMRHVSDVEIPVNTGDFRLMSRRVVDALLKMRERHRFMKGLFTWVGYPSASLLYDRDPRAAGKTSFNYWKLWNFALEGFTSHTVAPLKLATYLGFVVASFSLCYGAVMIVRTLIFGNPVPGYPSLMAVVLFLGGMQLVTSGIIGEYIGRLFNEAKNRPLYFVESFHAAWLVDPANTLGAPKS